MSILEGRFNSIGTAVVESGERKDGSGVVFVKQCLCKREICEWSEVKEVAQTCVEEMESLEADLKKT